jgi:hypothetical protein
MNWQPQDILSALDKCCENFTFPLLDNGYVYPAATRLSLYRSLEDWAMVIEVFGFSPRSGIPDIHVYTFASRLRRAKSVDDYVSRQAYEAYLSNNEHNESAFIHPIEEGAWSDPENSELLASGDGTVLVRGNPVATPLPRDYASHGITLEAPPRVHVFEFCRFLAASERNCILATSAERRGCVPPDLEQIMQLEEWNHPDVANNERPSGNAAFQSLADVLARGDVSAYQPSDTPNTHWTNWPEGGTL